MLIPLALKHCTGQSECASVLLYLSLCVCECVLSYAWPKTNSVYSTTTGERSSRVQKKRARAAVLKREPRCAARLLISCAAHVAQATRRDAADATRREPRCRRCVESESESGCRQRARVPERKCMG